MEFQSTESKVVEKALKDLAKQWDTEDYERAGQGFIKQLNLECEQASGTYIEQVKKRLKRNLTPEEGRMLRYYYRSICRRNLGVYLIVSKLDEVQERIRWLHEEIQRAEEELSRLQLYTGFSQRFDLQTVEQALGRTIEELQEIGEELRNLE